MSNRVAIDFFVIGVVKGGTTSWYHYLNQHPEIYLPKIKEVNFFSRSDIHPEDFMKSYAFDVNIDLDAYVKSGMKEMVHIAHVEKPDHYEALFSQRKDEKVAGEISNSYVICPSSAKAMYTAHPNAQIIVFLRNPVRRAWSQFLMNIREGKSRQGDFIKEIFEDHNKDKTGWGVNHQYLELGLYYQQIKNFLNYYPKEQFHYFLFEDMVANPQQMMKQVFKILGVNEDLDVDYSKKFNAGSMPRFSGVNRLLTNTGVLSGLKKVIGREQRERLKKLWYSGKKMPTLLDEHYEELAQFYKEDIEQLSELLNFNFREKWTI